MEASISKLLDNEQNVVPDVDGLFQEDILRETRAIQQYR